MPTRRKMLLAAAGGALARSVFAKASQPSTPVTFAVPPNACDCHTHIHGDPAKFPLSPTRVYTPETASPEEMTALHKALHIDRVVIVTPSIYATDNSATLFGLKARGATARGIAVIDAKTSESELDRLAAAGFVGIRINLSTIGVNDPAVGRERLEQAIARLKNRRGWHIQMYTSTPLIARLKDLIAASPVPVVFDHFGGLQASQGMSQPGLADLLELVRMGKAYVKVSGAYRSSDHGPDYPDVAPFAKALIAANPQRIVWGSDWPHPDSNTPAGHKATDITPLYKIDDGRLMNQLAVWAPDAATRKTILVDNPARLYGF